MGVTTAAAKMWLPATVSAGAAVVVATLAGLWASRSASLLKEREEENRRIPQLFGLRGRHRLPRVKDLDDPILLGVHPAATDGRGGAHARIPPFIARDASPELDSLLQRGGFVLVIGESTAGKSRFLYEAMRTHLPSYRVIQPTGREALRTAVARTMTTPRSVLWLDDLERFLGSDGLNGTMVDGVLAASGRDRFILATIRSEENAKYSGRSTLDSAEIGREALRHGWDVLRSAIHVHLPRSWSRDELDRASKFRTDPRVSDALFHTQFGLAEYLAAGPQLLAEWRDAWAPGTHPRAAALILAAIDARRVGIHRPLTLSILQQLHKHYLHERGGALLRPEPLDAAIAWAITPLHATSSLLLPAGTDKYLAFDYLIDGAPRLPVPFKALDDFIDYSTPDEALELGYAAWRWLRHEQADRAFRRAEMTLGAEATSSRCDLIRDRDGAAAALRFAKGIADQLAGKLGPKHPDTLLAKHRFGWELGMAGDPEAATQEMRRILNEAIHVYGDKNKQILKYREGLANWTGSPGNQEEAAKLYSDLVSHCTKTYGINDQFTYRCRNAFARWTMESGNTSLGIKLQEMLIADMQICRFPQTDIIGARHQLAKWKTRTRNYTDARKLWQQVIAERRTLDGRVHVRTLQARVGLADCDGEAGDPSLAAQEMREIVAESEHFGAPLSRTVLLLRYKLAHWTAKSGDTTSAIQELRKIAIIGVQEFGENDGTTTLFKRSLAHWHEHSEDRADITKKDQKRTGEC